MATAACPVRPRFAGCPKPSASQLSPFRLLAVPDYVMDGVITAPPLGHRLWGMAHPVSWKLLRHNSSSVWRVASLHRKMQALQRKEWSATPPPIPPPYSPSRYGRRRASVCPFAGHVPRANRGNQHRLADCRISCIPHWFSIQIAVQYNDP